MTMMTIDEMQDRILAKATEDYDFRERLIGDPKSAIAEELGVYIPEGFDIQVHQNTATTGHLILPPTDRLTESELELAVGGDYRDWSPD